MLQMLLLHYISISTAYDGYNWMLLTSLKYLELIV